MNKQKQTNCGKTREDVGKLPRKLHTIYRERCTVNGNKGEKNLQLNAHKLNKISTFKDNNKSLS